jgi:acyl-CoA thioester hydrolase
MLPTLNMSMFEDVAQLRVRYSETDRMGAFYNSRALEWFECGRTELMRKLGLPYTEMEARGVFLPLVEAHVEFLGRAQYDDLLEITTTASFEGKARLRCAVRIIQAVSRAPVVRGYTIHAFTTKEGKVLRPPAWFVEELNRII